MCIGPFTFTPNVLLYTENRTHMGDSKSYNNLTEKGTHNSSCGGLVYLREKCLENGTLSSVCVHLRMY